MDSSRSLSVLSARGRKNRKWGRWETGEGRKQGANSGKTRKKEKRKEGRVGEELKILENQIDGRQNNNNYWI